MCFVCGDALGVMKKANLQRHCISKHAKLNELCGQMRKEKNSALQQSLELQQTTFTRSRDSDKIIQASYVVSQLIVQKLKPHVEGEFVKERMVATVELLVPKKIKLFQSVSLSRRTVSDRIIDLSQDIEDIERMLQGIFNFSLWLVMRPQT